VEIVPSVRPFNDHHEKVAAVVEVTVADRRLKQVAVRFDPGVDIDRRQYFGCRAASDGLWRRKSGRFDDRPYFLTRAASTVSTALRFHCHPELVEGSLTLPLVTTRIMTERNQRSFDFAQDDKRKMLRAHRTRDDRIRGEFASLPAGAQAHDDRCGHVHARSHSLGRTLLVDHRPDAQRLSRQGWKLAVGPGAVRLRGAILIRLPSAHS